MVGILGLFVVGPMAAIAFPRSASIDAVLVAGAAIQRRMDALERKDTAVAEIRLVPGRIGSPMTRFTGRRKTGGHVVRISGLLVVGAMAAITFSRRSGIDAVLMTGHTFKRGVHALTREDAVMVERGLVPAGLGRQMAELASRRESRLGMVGFGGLLIIFAVTGITIEGGLAEVSVLVATVTA